MGFIHLKSTEQCNSSDVSDVIKAMFFRVLVTTEPNRSLLIVRCTNCVILNIENRLSSKLQIKNCNP